MTKFHLLGLSVALSLFASAALAVPTILGSTGGMILPDTNVQQGKAITVSHGDDFGDPMFPLTALQVGISDKLELGVVYANGSDMGGENVLQAFNAKYATGIGGGYRGAIGVQIGEDNSYVHYDGDKFQNYYATVSSDTLLKNTTVMLNLTATKVNGYKSIVVPGIGVAKGLSNGGKLGAEILLGKKNAGDFDNFDGYRWGTVYADLPITAEFSVRGGFLGIGDPDGTDFVMSGTYLFSNDNF